MSKASASPRQTNILPKNTTFSLRERRFPCAPHSTICAIGKRPPALREVIQYACATAREFAQISAGSHTSMQSAPDGSHQLRQMRAGPRGSHPTGTMGFSIPPARMTSSSAPVASERPSASLFVAGPAKANETAATAPPRSTIDPAISAIDAVTFAPRHARRQKFRVRFRRHSLITIAFLQLGGRCIAPLAERIAHTSANKNSICCKVAAACTMRG